MAKISTIQGIAAGLRGVKAGLKTREEREEREKERRTKEEEREFQRDIQTSQLQRGLERDIRDEASQRELSALRESAEERAVSAEGRAVKKAEREEGEFETKKLKRQKDALGAIQDEEFKRRLQEMEVMTKEGLLEAKVVGFAYHAARRDNTDKAIKLLQPLYDKKVVGAKTVDGNLKVFFEDGTLTAIKRNEVGRSLRAAGIIGVKDSQLLTENRSEITSLAKEIEGLGTEFSELRTSIKDEKDKAVAVRGTRRAANIMKEIRAITVKIEALKTANANLGRPIPGSEEQFTGAPGLPTTAPDSALARAVTKQPQAPQPAPPQAVTTPEPRTPIAAPVSGRPAAPAPSGEGLTAQQASEVGISQRDFAALDTNKSGTLELSEVSRVLELARQTLNDPNSSEENKIDAQTFIDAFTKKSRSRSQVLIGQ